MSIQPPNLLRDFHPAQLSPNLAEALRYLQLPRHMGEGDLPAKLQQQLAHAEQQILQTAQPRCVLRQFLLDFSATANTGEIKLSGSTLSLSGNSALSLLENCSSALIMACTIGLDIDRLITKAQPSDMAHALMLDALASAAIENLCDQAEAYIKALFQQQSLKLTRRFSPGYGDLPISLQSSLCRTLDTARQIGLTVTASGIMLPRKSVTAIIGVGSDIPAANQDICSNKCLNCPNKQCIYRNS